MTDEAGQGARLIRLAGRQFRNLADFDLDTSARFVVFSGPNAQGKTNAIEAVWMLCSLRPLRSPRTREVLKWGHDQGALSGDAQVDGLRRQRRVDLSKSGRVVYLDGKRVTNLTEYFSVQGAVSFIPADEEIVSGEPSVRRRWIDRAAFTAAPAHLDVVRRYKRCLAQKSAALKAPRPDLDMLDAIDGALAQAGAMLVDRRVAALEALRPHVTTMHADISGTNTKIGLTYRTAASGETLGERVEALAGAIATVRPKELRRRMCLAGPQSDGVRVDLDGHPARAYASRGQVRSVVLALKLAELVAARARGDQPLFLLDDVSSELDRSRTRRLVQVLRDLGTQVFATTTDPAHMDGLPAGDTLHIPVNNGVLG